MLNIVICEDNKAQRLKIENYINESIKKNNFECEIVKSTNNPFEVIEYAKKNINDLNVYFFDIDLKNEINGIEAAAQIRQEDVNCYFIFITGHNEYSMMTFEYKLQALDYIDKSDFLNLYNKIDNCIKTVYGEYLKSNNFDKETEEFVTIKSGTRMFKLPYTEILYFETISNHKVRVHTITSYIEYYGNLIETMNNLNSKFFYRVHKAFIINLTHVEELNTKDMYALMGNGDKCTLSKRYARDLIKR